MFQIKLKIKQKTNFVHEKVFSFCLLYSIICLPQWIKKFRQITYLADIFEETGSGMLPWEGIEKRMDG